MPHLSTCLGTETVADGFAKVHALHCQAGGKETFLQGAGKLGKEVRPHGSPVREAAVAGIRREIGGEWSFQNFEVAEGEVIKLFAQKRQAFNKLILSAQMYIRMREDGPLTQVTIPLLNRAGKSRVAEAVFSGKFDVITVKEAMDLAGVATKPQFERMFSKINQDTVFEVRELVKAKSLREKVTAKVVKDEAGNTEVIRVRRKIRNLSF